MSPGNLKLRRLYLASLAALFTGCGGGGGGGSTTASITDEFTLGTYAAPVRAEATSVQAGSKFAAHVSQAGENLHLLHSGIASATTSGVPVTVDNEDRILEATIKTANKSDLLVGVSLQSTLLTDTLVSGKNGSSEVAKALAAIMVRIEVDGNRGFAFPTSVVFAKQIQELTATLSGVIRSCKVNVTDTTGDGVIDSGEIVIARDCVVTDEQIGLALTNTSANHFNFVVPNVSSGQHSVKVFARAMSSAEFKNGLTPTEFDANGNPIDFAETANNSAKAWALVDVGSLTVEQVRATNQEGGIIIDVDAPL